MGPPRDRLGLTARECPDFYGWDLNRSYSPGVAQADAQVEFSPFTKPAASPAAAPNVELVVSANANVAPGAELYRRYRLK